MKKGYLVSCILLMFNNVIWAANRPSLEMASTVKAAVPVQPAATVAAPDPVVRALLVPDRETILGASMSGRLIDLSPRPGEHVSKGQVVAQFDCTEPRARRDMAKAELESARLTHEGKIRLQGLQSAAELEVELAAAAVTKAQAQLGVAKAQLSQCSLAAPFAGRVVKWHAKAFQGVNAGAPLIEIVSDASPRVKVNVPSRWLVWLKPGARFEIDIEETAKRYKARVQQLNGRIDPVSQTIEIEASLIGNASDLLPGMSGTALFDHAP